MAGEMSCVSRLEEAMSDDVGCGGVVEWRSIADERADLMPLSVVMWVIPAKCGRIGITILKSQY